MEDPQLDGLAGYCASESGDNPVVPFIAGMIGIDMENPFREILRLSVCGGRENSQGAAESEAGKRGFPHPKSCMFETS